MNEQSKLSYKLTVENKSSDGRIKDLRYISHTPIKTTEFVPNKLYIHLVNSGYIKSGTFKVPLLLGSVKKVKHGNY